MSYPKVIQRQTAAGTVEYVRSKPGGFLANSELAQRHSEARRKLRWVRDDNGRLVREFWPNPNAAPLSATELDVRQDAPAPSPFTECFVCPDCHRCLAHEVCKCEPPDIEEPAWLQNYNPEDDLPDSEDGIATYRFD